MLANTLCRPPFSQRATLPKKRWLTAWRGGGLLAVSCSLVLALGAGDALAGQAPVSLGAAGSFAALGGQTVTNTGPTTLGGDLGVSPGSSLTGFPPGNVNGATHGTDPTAARAQADLTAAYNDAASRQPSQALPADLGGRTLTPGVYKAAALALTGGLTLDGQGDPHAVFVIQVGSALTTNARSVVALINGAKPGNVFWQVGSSATLGASSFFSGNILALTSISVDSGVTLDGRALARNGAVTLIDDTINVPTASTPPPPPPPPPFPKAPVSGASIGAAFKCVRAPANEPMPPPLPSFASLDRIETHLVNVTALCPSGEDPQAQAIYAPKKAAKPCPKVAGVKNCIASTRCPKYPGTPFYYCHEIEEKFNVSDIGMIARFRNAKPSVAGGQGAHSITQLWAIQPYGKTQNQYSTLETGWIVSPDKKPLGFGESKPHLFEYHTGDNYTGSQKVDCYDRCGLHGVKRSKVVAGQRISSTGTGTYVVELYKRRWWFYYGGYWYGYIAQHDKSWKKHPIKHFTLAQAGGEVEGPKPCLAVQMGNGKLGTSARSAAVNQALLFNKVPKLSTSLPASFLKPSDYFSEGSNGPGGSRYVAGGFMPAVGGFHFGGPGGCNAKAKAK